MTSDSFSSIVSPEAGPVLANPAVDLLRQHPCVGVDFQTSMAFMSVINDLHFFNAVEIADNKRRTEGFAR